MDKEGGREDDVECLGRKEEQKRRRARRGMIIEENEPSEDMNYKVKKVNKRELVGLGSTCRRRRRRHKLDRVGWNGVGWIRIGLERVWVEQDEGWNRVGVEQDEGWNRKGWGWMGWVT